MLCPTCGSVVAEPIQSRHYDDSVYRAQRRLEAAECVASYRSAAEKREKDGKFSAAAAWRGEADKIEAKCARVWGKPDVVGMESTV